MEKPFDKAELANLDVSLRSMVDKSYELCLYRCAESKEVNMTNCKQTCFKRIMIPYRHGNHIARDNEETHYRRCLSQ